LLFGKRKKPGAVQSQLAERKTSRGIRNSEVIRIEFDMMLKGSVYRRRGGDVRQFGVTVHGATRLVTSGDIVDRSTYEALLAAGAIRPAAPPQKSSPPRQERTAPSNAPERPPVQAKPEEPPRQPSSHEPKPRELRPPPQKTDTTQSIAVPESKPDPKKAPEDETPPPEAEAAAENDSPDSQASAKAKPSKEGPGPRVRSSKSRRRRGSR
jgi:outer membrane biosynthesis protein TonB